MRKICYKNIWNIVFGSLVSWNPIYKRVIGATKGLKGKQNITLFPIYEQSDACLTSSGVWGPQTNIFKPHLLDFIDLLDKDILWPFFPLPLPKIVYSLHTTEYTDNTLTVILHISRHINNNTPNICAEQWACHRCWVFFVSYMQQLVTMRPNYPSGQNTVCCVSHWRKDSQTPHSPNTTSHAHYNKVQNQGLSYSPQKSLPLTKIN